MTCFWKLLSMALLLVTVAADVPPDKDENCEMWAERGECSINPDYMLEYCATSCQRTASMALKDHEHIKEIKSFFDLSAKDIHGKLIEFSQFEGQVTIVVNVASYCGYTDSHYHGLVELWNHVKHTGKVNILAFPCNQFGNQEPDSNDEIDHFARTEYGVEFTMMEKTFVNGEFAHVVYKYLKSQAGPRDIVWNFATYYVIAPDGQINVFNGAEPMDLKEVALSLARGDEL